MGGMMTTMPLDSASLLGLDQSGVRRTNTVVVLRALSLANEPLTLQDLGESTGLSRRTLEAILGELVEAGRAVEAETTATGGAGRPAKRYGYVAEHRLAVALRINTHFGEAMIVDLRGRVLGRAIEPLGADYLVPERAIDQLARAFERAIAAAEVSRDRVAAGTLAAGGIIDTDQGRVVRLVNAPLWSDFPLAERLSAVLALPCTIDNDANLAAFAEHRIGSGRGVDSVTWVVHGARTGIGVVLGGAIHRGRRGAAGELIESSVVALPRDVDHPAGLLSSPDAAQRARAVAVVDSARAGEPRARELVDEFVDQLADLIDVLTWTVAPELIVPLLLARLTERGVPDPAVCVGALGSDSVLLGAALNAVAEVESMTIEGILADADARASIDLAAPGGTR